MSNAQKIPAERGSVYQNEFLQEAGVLQLPTDEAHLWHVRPGSPPGNVASSADLLLDSTERERYERIVSERTRVEFMTARILCRTVLSRYAPVAPTDWHFAQNAFGRPHIASPPGHEWLRYNMSHSYGLVVCAVVRDSDIGVDVEAIRASPDMDEIAHTHFAPSEARSLERLPPAARTRRFFELWTLKESYLKARGTGLALPLDRFAFDLDRAGPIRVTCDPALSDVPEAWQFEQIRLYESHALAVALRGGSGRRIRLRTFALAA